MSLQFIRNVSFSNTSVLTIMLGLSIASPTFGDGPSTAATGINSQGLGLDGTGVSIGQVEVDRVGSTPAVSPFDDTAHSNATVIPAAVFLHDGNPIQNQNIDVHPEHVAGIMISSDAQHLSVAPLATLYGSAYVTEGIPGYQHALLAMQHVAIQAGGTVRAVNLSWNKAGTADGQSLLTRGLDWSAFTHDALYVQIRGNTTSPGIVPADCFNGIVVASSRIDNGVFRRVGDTDNPADAGSRRVVNIMAPGIDIWSSVLGETGGIPNFDQMSGTSMAAPHVTGTVALLQQYANQEGWTDAAQRHEVMKAVLMNSADKLMDSGDGKRLCMEKDILNKAGAGWLQSDAFGPATTHPVDDEMGTGQLNAKRALKQFESGQHGPGNVPLIGWDYGITAAARDIKKYKLEKPLEADSFFAATLAWDREVELAGGDSDGQYDSGETFNVLGLTDMDLYLVPAGSTSDTQAVAKSATTIYGVEHIFFQVPAEGEYELWVQQANAPLGDQPYAVAWWAKADPGMCPTDLNDDGATDGGDLAIFLSEWGPNCGHPADFDRNGVVNGMDQAILLAEWGPCTCPPGCGPALPLDPFSGTGGCPVGCKPQAFECHTGPCGCAGFGFDTINVRFSGWQAVFFFQPTSCFQSITSPSSGDIFIHRVRGTEDCLWITTTLPGTTFVLAVPCTAVLVESCPQTFAVNCGITCIMACEIIDGLAWWRVQIGIANFIGQLDGHPLFGFGSSGFYRRPRLVNEFCPPMGNYSLYESGASGPPELVSFTAPPFITLSP